MRINVDSQALHESRIKRLAVRVGRSHRHVLGDLLFVWNDCYERRAVYVTYLDVAAQVDPEFAPAMVAEGLATELLVGGPGGGLGDVSDETLRVTSPGTPRGTSRPMLKIAGVEARIEWLLGQDAKREVALERKREARNNPTPRGRSKGNPGERPSTPAHAHALTPDRIPEGREDAAAPGEAFHVEPSALERAAVLRDPRLAPPLRKAAEVVGFGIEIPEAPDEVEEAPHKPAAPVKPVRAATPRPETPLVLEPPAPGPLNRMKDAVDGFHTLYLAARGVGPTWGGREMKKLEGFLKRCGGTMEFLRRAEIMFESAPAWPAEHGGDLDTLMTHYDKFAGGGRAKAGKKTALDAVLALARDDEETHGDNE